MRPLAILFPLLLAACAGPPGSGEVVPIRWVEMDNIKDRCGFDAAACYRIIGSVCTVFTRRARGPYDDPLHTALGHETRHCFHGDFHPRTQFLELGRLAR